MSYAGTYTGTVHTYCAEFDTNDPITFSIDAAGNIDFPSYTASWDPLHDGTVDGSGRVSGGYITVQSRSLGMLNIPYNGTDDGSRFYASGTSVNGITSTIQATLVPVPTPTPAPTPAPAPTPTPAPAPTPTITRVTHRDGSHTITGNGDDLTLRSIHNDTMTGGGVRDTFVFKPGFGQAEITDFTVGTADHDYLNLAATPFHSLAQVLLRTSMADGNATIHVNARDSITLDGVTKAQLKAHPGDFIFA